MMLRERLLRDADPLRCECPYSGFVPGTHQRRPGTPSLLRVGIYTDCGFHGLYHGSTLSRRNTGIPPNSGIRNRSPEKCRKFIRSNCTMELIVLGDTLQNAHYRQQCLMGKSPSRNCGKYVFGEGFQQSHLLSVNMVSLNFTTFNQAVLVI